MFPEVAKVRGFGYHEDMFDAKTAARFWGKVNKDGPVPEAHPLMGPCWIWISLSGTGGYGQMFMAGKSMYAHRISYLLNVGQIPDGMVVNHKCEVRNCVRPDHLVAATQRDNVHRARAWEYGAALQRKKTHCREGHEYAGKNLRISKDGSRSCKTCEREYSRKHRVDHSKPRSPKIPKTHCPAGHEYTEENTYIAPSRGTRNCRTCKRNHVNQYRVRVGERMQVKTHCKYGHPFDEENTHVDRFGNRSCLACRRRNSAESNERVRIQGVAHRSDACKNGHPYTGDNTLLSGGQRACRICNRETMRERRGAGGPERSSIEQLATHTRLYKTHCKHGHEWTSENTVFAGTRRSCRQCQADRDAARN